MNNYRTRWTDGNDLEFEELKISKSISYDGKRLIASCRFCNGIMADLSRSTRLIPFVFCWRTKKNIPDV